MSSSVLPISVLTLARNRNGYLRHLVRGLVRSRTPPAELVVVRAGGSENPADVLPDDAPFPIRLLGVAAPTERIPYAQARNRAARAATAEAIVFMDADCIPARSLVGRFGAALAEREALCIGDVLYLPPGPAHPPQAGPEAWTEASLQKAARPHPRRVRPPESGTAASPHYEMAWGLCLALRRETFWRLGGFDEGYGGYAGEDTDLAFAARAAGVPLRLVAGAEVFHQHHDVYEPPLQQMEATVANARRFRAKWGRWPMGGWLRAFADAGLIRWTPDADTLRVLRAPTAGEVESARYESAAAFRS